MNTHPSKPVEVSILDTKDAMVNLIRSNKLGVTINRMIVQEILAQLQQEEQIIVSQMKAEWEKEQEEKQEEEQTT